MAHPVLTDPSLSVPVVLYMRPPGGAEETCHTRGVVHTDFVGDTEGLAAPQGVVVQVPSPARTGEHYNDRPVEYATIQSIGVERYRVVNVEVSGAALGSTGLDWRSLTLRLQRDTGG